MKKVFHITNYGHNFKASKTKSGNVIVVRYFTNGSSNTTICKVKIPNGIMPASWEDARQMMEKAQLNNTRKR